MNRFSKGYRFIAAQLYAEIMRKKPPRWQKGHMDIDIVVPADRTESSKEETVKLRLRWEVKATKAMGARARTKWEMDRARHKLACASHAGDVGSEFASRQVDDLDSAVIHVVRAWC